MGLFDHLQDTAFGTVAHVMGYGASWAPAGGGSALSAQVLYKGPTEKEKLLSADYDPDKLVIEYKEGDFEGLKALVDLNGTPEQVNITGIGSFYIKSIRKLYDGKTFEAQLQQI